MATETGNTAEERCQRDKETLVACCSSCKFVSGEEILNRMIGSGISQFTNLKISCLLHSRPEDDVLYNVHLDVFYWYHFVKTSVYIYTFLF